MFISWWRKRLERSSRRSQRGRSRKPGRGPGRYRPRAELLEGRVAPAAWVENGPASISDGPGGPAGGALGANAAGAVQAIAVDPHDSTSVYLGSVNGGLWHTSDAQDSPPHWVLQADGAISALAFDPRDNGTIYAGTGNMSSTFTTFLTTNQEPKEANGLLVTTNGGLDWNLLGQSTFAGLRIRSIVPFTDLLGRQVILVATLDALSTAGPGGLYRSDDGGTTWHQLSGGGDDPANPSGLPYGSVSSLVADPSGFFGQSFYAGVMGPNWGVYHSSDSGKTWQSRTAGLNPNYGGGRVELAVSAASPYPVYVALLGAGVLFEVDRSDNHGTSWESMNAPNTLEQPGGFQGAFPGKQGMVHFSMAADPTDPNIIYIGGDRQPGPSEGAVFPNASGVSGYLGRHFRGVFHPALGQIWTDIDGTEANGSTTHADSRVMVFANSITLLEGDDGGIYRLVYPDISEGRAWQNINGDLRITELDTIGYDSLNRVLIGGAQDNGVPIQLSPGSTSWVEAAGGDGQNVFVDNSDPSKAVYYFSSQRLGGFRRVTVGPGNVVTDNHPIGLDMKNPDGSLMTNPDGSLTTLSQFLGGKDKLLFRTPFAINAVNPRRMLIGTDGYVLESFDQGDTLTQSLLSATVGPIVYGGYLAGSPNADLVILGTASRLLIRQGPAATSLFQVVKGYPGSTPVQIVVNPYNWTRIYVLDNKGQIWQSVDGKVADPLKGSNWRQIDTTLPGTLKPVTIAVIPSPLSGQGETVLAGGSANQNGFAVTGGVYASLDASLGSGPLPTWNPLGQGLPNVQVKDLVYSIRDDVLVAATHGRGAWKLANVTGELNSHFLLSVPGSATAGQPVAITVSVLQNRNFVDDGYGGTVHLVATAGFSGATVSQDYGFKPGDASKGGDAGQHTFTFTLNTAEPYFFSVSDSGGTSKAGNPLTVSNASVVSFKVEPLVSGPVVAGDPFSVKVTALDRFGNTVTDFLQQVSYVLPKGESGSGGGVDGYTFMAADQGQHVFPGVTLNAPAAAATIEVEETLDHTHIGKAVVKDVRGKFAVTAPTDVFDIPTAEGIDGGGDSGPTVAQFVAFLPDQALTDGKPRIIAGAPFNLVVIAQDDAGNTVLDYPTPVHFTSSDGAAALPGDSRFDYGAGTFQPVLNTVGDQTVTISDGGNVSLTILVTVVQGSTSATHFRVQVGTPGSGGGTAAAGQILPVTVTALNDFDQVDTGYTGTVQFTSTDDQTVLPPDYPFQPGDQGVHTFQDPGVLVKTTGAQTIRVADQSNPSLQGGGDVTVVPGAAVHFQVLTRQTVVAGKPFTVFVTAQDAYGNTDYNYGGVVSFTSPLDGQALLPPDTQLDAGQGVFYAVLNTIGTQQVVAADTHMFTVTGSSGVVNVVPPGARQFEVIPADVFPVAGQPFAVFVTALDGVGDVVNDYAGTVTFASSSKAAVLPADASLPGGSGTFTVTIGAAGSNVAIQALDKANNQISGTGVVTVVAPPTLTVTNTNDSGDGSLRDAITRSNNAHGFYLINFNIDRQGIQTINLLSPLPDVTNPVIIDGTTQPGYAGAPVIELNGAAAGSGANGLTISAGSTTVRGLVINRFGQNGIVLQTNGFDVIQGNYIGTDVTGTLARGNSALGSRDFSGLVVRSGNNLIGGTAAADRNVISGNDFFGLVLSGPGAANNLVEGNYIGVDKTGGTPLGNGNTGIFVNDQAANNLIGGTAAGARNVISNNGWMGVEFNFTANHNTAAGNYIGTNAAGTARMGNRFEGIIFYFSANNVAGGTAPGAGNLISANMRNGILFVGPQATGNQVLGNLIGLDALGKSSLGNGSDGIAFDSGASNNVIGGPDAASGNRIADNGGIGVDVEGGSGNAILHNAIFDNQQSGITLDNGGNHSQPAPVLTSAVTTSTGTVIQGTLHGTPATTYAVEVFANPPATAPGVLLQDTFDSENGGRGAGNYAAFANWDVTRGSVDLLGNGFFDFFPDHGLYLDMDGSTFLAGRLESKAAFQLDPGAYTLKFDVAGSQRGDTNTMTVSLGNLYREAFTLNSDVPFETITRIITVDSATAARLVFDHAGGDNIGLLLDNVVLEKTSTSAQGRQLLSSAPETTDGNGDVSFTLTLPPVVLINQVVTATATAPGNDTSTFSAGVVQPNSVVSLPNIANGNPVTLAAAPGTTLANVGAMTNPAPVTGPPDQNYPIGFLSFTVQGVAPGGATTVTVALPPGVTVNTFWKYGPTPANHSPHWYQFLFNKKTDADDPAGTGAEFVGGNQILLHLVDGRRGDDDLTANGVIVDPGAPGLDALTPNQHFVAQVYRDLLHREAELAGLAGWAGALDQGFSRTDIVAGIEGGLEYRVGEVEGLYQLYLRRPADDPGLLAAAAFLGSGGTAGQLAAFLAGSPEYFQTRAGGSNDGFLDALYADALGMGRTMDTDGRAAADLALGTGTMTRAQVAAALLASDEYRRDQVKLFYQEFLGRAADAPGLGDWTSGLQAGLSRDQEIAGILGDPHQEYFQKANP